jgi:hypothetical protein
MSRFVLIALFFAAASPAAAQVGYGTAGATYTQGFDTLATSGTTNAWSNNGTIQGWYLFRQSADAPVAITTYSGGNGGSGTGNFWSYGTGAETERALGGLGSGGAYFGSPLSGAAAGWIAVAVSNDTGEVIDEAEVLFDGEQWRNGGNTTAQTMVMEYGFGATFDAVTWNAAGAAFNFTSPIATASAGALNGNDPANRIADLGGTLTSLGWDPGETLWFRWTENNDAGNDHGLAIDNFRFTGVPEPSAFALALLSAAGFTAVRRRAAASSNA